MTRNLTLCTHTAVIALLVGAHAALAADPGGDGLQEVVVTATKRATSLQETPLAVTALNSTALQNAHVQTVADIVHLVPSFQATTEGDHDVITLTLRGIGNDSAKTEYADPEVALFVDGVYAPRAEGATSLLFDLDSIEVLRGPQGTLWGRNSTVGAVNMKTAKPSLDAMSGYAQFGVGDYAAFGARAALNLPLADNFAIRVSAAHEQHDGYVDYQSPHVPSLASQKAAWLAAGGTPAGFQPINPDLFVTDGPKYSAQDQTAARISALWKPFDSVTWNVSFEGFQDRGTPNANLMQQPRAGQEFWSTLATTAPYLDRDAYSLRSRIDWQVDDYLHLAYIAGYSWYSGTSDFDQDGGAGGMPAFWADPNVTQQEDRTDSSNYYDYQHELEVSSSGHHDVDWILGFFYAAENNNIRFDIPIMNGTQSGTVNWQGSFIQPEETEETKAVFGQATYNITDQIHLTGGLRYSEDDKANHGGLDYGWCGNACPSGATVAQVPVTAAIDPASPSSGFSPYAYNTASYHDQKLTYLARIGWDVTPDFLTYASVSTGYKSGGLQDGGSEPGQVVPYAPETLTNYEIGTKNTFFDHRMIWNNSAFYEDFSNFQFSSAVTLADGNHTLRTSNAAGAKVYGLESELAAKITPKDTVQLSVSLLHAKLGELQAGSNDYTNLGSNCPNATDLNNCAVVTGNAMPHSPNFAAQLSYQHSFDLPNGAVLVPLVSTHFETTSWLSVFHDGPGDRQDAYTRTDLSLRYISASSPSWSIEAYIHNVEGDNIKTDALTWKDASGNFVYLSQYLPPRTFGANVRVEFGGTPEPPPPMPAVAPEPAPAAPPPPQAAKPPEAQRQFQVFFDFDKAEITDAASGVIAAAAKVVQAGGVAHVTVIGHTDTVGAAAYNLALSQRRAEAVKQRLVADGVGADEIETAGAGKSGLLVPTADGVREPQNRRAVIELQ